MPSPSRNPPAARSTHQHAPTTPSQLRESHYPSGSPEASTHTDFGTSSAKSGAQVPASPAHSSPTSAQPLTPLDESEPNLRTHLLSPRDGERSPARPQEMSPPTRSPRPETARSYGSFNSEIYRDGFGGRYPGDDTANTPEAAQSLLGESVTDGLLGGQGKTSTTSWLAERHGIRNKRMMYLAYYVPIFNWIPQYKLRYLRGDLVAAITMASFYIPMSLSYASNLGHIPPVNGLYSFFFNPLIYAILGTAPMMVVGPEAPGSLLTGEVVRENIRKGKIGDDEAQLNAEIAGITTFIAGFVILLGGLFRLGFLDNVLSRPFLRGFISAIGVVIFIDQLIPQLGIARLADGPNGVQHGSAVDKLVFIIKNVGHAHKLTCAISFSAFFVIMFFRELKKRLQPRYPGVAYVPDRFVVVVLSVILTWKYRWDEQGLAILGDVNTAGGHLFKIHFPFDFSHLKYVSDAFETAFTIALLGFFESSVAAKSLPPSKDGLQKINTSTNRELVALGVANVTGGLFMALPAFGGYGRSKVNASTGGRTPMSSIFLSLITLFCLLFLLPYFYYLPKGVLSAMVGVVAFSLVEEAPHDIHFFVKIRGWSELSLMLIIFVVTIFWDLKKGIAVGIGLSLLRVIKHATRPRIQILGRVPGTSDQFENAEVDPGRLEFVEGCLIVKIPEPLTFANTGSLRNRLKRLEEHGTNAAHPALPRVRREEHNKNIIFDVHGVTSLDGAGAQVLLEIVQNYVERGVRVFFCRVPREGSEIWRLFQQSGIVETVGGPRHFVNSVDQALRMTELESLTEALERESGSG
ncbi:sulfate transporter/antisigma-factor antagonist STAS [Botryosphaeria dothidea]|uniref:Sulfate transporter/antisigma-factor antagonist STAS n=1 Tax=Botryosphaeria dothidea TaxID=55169 RepID=A0A8H4MXE5_9PEZI|nr:sulfate transporter/antisigma-factor antagonist STAS [Botryosphaeria dothidea]